MKRSIRIALAVFAGLVVLVLGAVVSIPLIAPNELREAALRRVSSAIGSEVAVTGEFRLTPSLTPALVATEVTVANAPWGSRPEMFSAQRLEIELQLMPLLFGAEIRIDRLVVAGADVLLESGKNGLNWLSHRSSQADHEARSEQTGRNSGLAALTEVALRDSRILYKDLETGRSWDGSVERLNWQANDLESTLVIDAIGSYADERVALRGTLGAIATLLDFDEPYPVDLNVEVGSAAMNVAGLLGLPAAAEATDLAIGVDRLERETLESLLDFGMPLPGPYSGQARMVATSAGLALSDLDLRAGGPESVFVSITGGEIADLMRGENLMLPTSLQASSLSALGERFGLALPDLGSVELEGRITGSIVSADVIGLTGRIESRKEDDRLLEITDGQIDNPLEPEAVDLAFRLQGSSLASLGRTLGLPLPALGPYRVRANLTGSPANLTFTGLNGIAGGEGGLQLQVEEGSVADLRGDSVLSLPVKLFGPELAHAAQLVGRSIEPFGPVTLTGTLSGTPSSLALEGLDGRAGSAPAATVEMAGTIDNIREARGLAIDFVVEARSLAELQPLFDLELAASPALRLSGRLHGDVSAFTLKETRLTIDDAIAMGTIEIAGLFADRPKITGRLQAKQLDLDRLPGLFGDGAGRADDGREATLPVDFMDELEADLALQADELTYAGYRLNDVQAKLLLSNGTLSLDNVSAKIASGTLSADFVADAEPRSATTDVSFRLTADNLSASQLLPLDKAERATGELDIDIAVDATGRTVDQLIGDLQGEVTLLSEQGRLTDVPLNRLVPDLDIFGILPFFQDRDPTIRVNCLIGEFDVEEGVARTDALLDTERMTILGEGSINLDARTLDLTFQPRSKSRKLSKSSIPIDIRGSLTDPAIEPRVPEAVGGAVRGFFGGLLVPLNQISALFGDEAIDACGDALREAAERRGPRG